MSKEEKCNFLRSSKNNVRYNFSSSTDNENDDSDDVALCDFLLSDDYESRFSSDEEKSKKAKKRKLLSKKSKSKNEEKQVQKKRICKIAPKKNAESSEISNLCVSRKRKWEAQSYDNKSDLQNVISEEFLEKKVKIEKIGCEPVYGHLLKIKSEFDCKTESNDCNDDEIKTNIKLVKNIKTEIESQNVNLNKIIKREKKDSSLDLLTSNVFIKKEIKCKKEPKTRNKKEIGKEEDAKDLIIVPKVKDTCSINYKSSSNAKYRFGDREWESYMLSEKSNIEVWAARNIINLFENDCTIPFIARYRRDKTRNMDADTLRHVKHTYEDIKTLETKVENVLKQIKKTGKLNPQLEKSICGVHSLDELDFIYAPFKQGSSKSKAEKARTLGLEDHAYVVLTGSEIFLPDHYIDGSRDGLKTVNEILENIQNIIADIFSKDEDVLEYLHTLEKQVQITIKSSKSKTTANSKTVMKEYKTKNNTKEDPQGKFELYYNFQTSVKTVQPHQILALNRGKNLKILCVKFIVSDWLSNKLQKFCESKWLRTGLSYPLRAQMFNNSFQDSYNRLILPLVVRRVKSELNRKAHYAAIENFALNLKNLLQMPPIKGCSILGIDPGIRYGFKFALISSSGDLLWTSVFHFNITNLYSQENKRFLGIIKENLISHNCELIAIGNGTGCRIIENIISHHIKYSFFEPHLNVKYTIVNERGASVYSCTNLAKEEFPNLDTNLVSAVFIARSLQDPLSEYVKVEPKHLGVGMYQHDLPEKKLNDMLDEIVGECVSFTGVDINTASVHLLKRISGLSVARACNIIEWRSKNGPFRNRENLKLVKGIGKKTFEQCSGFIRIHPQTVILDKANEPTKSKSQKSINENINPLDRTWIHPESYNTASAFVEKCNANLQELGTESFIKKIKDTVNSEANVKRIASCLTQTENVIKFIADALMKPNDYDYRSQFAKPVFKQGVTEISSLKLGMVLTGVIANVTNFGAFVDIGVGIDGLIHIKHMNGFTLQIGDRVEVKILNIQLERERIGLFLMQLLN